MDSNEVINNDIAILNIRLENCYYDYSILEKSKKSSTSFELHCLRCEIEELQEKKQILENLLMEYV
jgi:hypothetical protein